MLCHHTLAYIPPANMFLDRLYILLCSRSLNTLQVALNAVGLLLMPNMPMCCILVQELQLQSDASDNKPRLRPESRSQAEVAADQLVGRATSEILMSVASIVLNLLASVPNPVTCG